MSLSFQKLCCHLLGIHTRELSQQSGNRLNDGGNKDLIAFVPLDPIMPEAIPWTFQLSSSINSILTCAVWTSFYQLQ